MIKVDDTISIKHISRSTSSTLVENLEAFHVSIQKSRKSRILYIYVNTLVGIFHLLQYSYMVLCYYFHTFLHGSVPVPFSFDQILQQRH